MNDIFPKNIDFKTIGLLGGSFNPSHEGHLDISLEAIKYLELDGVWWLVSPGNPLKSNKNLPPVCDRLLAAKKIIGNTPIIANNIEKNLGTIHTIDTLLKMTKARPKTKFIWLMGEDNMIQFPLWKDWEKIIALLPIAVFKRDGYSQKAQKGEMATRFGSNQIPSKNIGVLKKSLPPAWGIIPNKLNLTSSTSLRKLKNKP